MRSVEDVRLCAAAGADALGFVFAHSPRRLTIDAAAVLTAVAPPAVRCVGVFADAPREFIEEALRRCRLDLLQFAGHETAEFCGSFGRATWVTVRAHVPAPDLLQRARAAAVIADASIPGARGGTGTRIENDLARRLRRACDRPFVLAGGLTPGDVGEAIDVLRPDGVDVSSGVERDGHKDALLVRAFAKAVKEAYATRS